MVAKETASPVRSLRGRGSLSAEELRDESVKLRFLIHRSCAIPPHGKGSESALELYSLSRR